MSDSYSQEDQPPVVSAFTPEGSGSEEERGTMTKEERLAKLARNAITRPTRGEAKPPRESFEDMVAKPLLRRPVDSEKILGCRGGGCQFVHG